MSATGKHARRTDPDTSKAAQPSVFSLSRQCQSLLQQIERQPRRTAAELGANRIRQLLLNLGQPSDSDVNRIAARIYLESRKTSRRVSDLAEAGFIVESERRKCRVTGRMSRCWVKAPSVPGNVRLPVAPQRDTDADAADNWRTTTRKEPPQ